MLVGRTMELIRMWALWRLARELLLRSSSAPQAAEPYGYPCTAGTKAHVREVRTPMWLFKLQGGRAVTVLVCMIKCMAVASLAQTSELPFNFMGQVGGDGG